MDLQTDHRKVTAHTISFKDTEGAMDDLKTSSYFDGDLPESLKTSKIKDFIVSDFGSMKKSVRKFYEEQNDLIEFFLSAREDALPTLELPQQHIDCSKDMDSSKCDIDSSKTYIPEKLLRRQFSVYPRSSESFAINLSFYINVALTALKALALISSGSMAVLASLADSMLDLLSGAVLFFSKRAVERVDHYKYPQGNRRLEPLGVIVFSCIMGVSSFQIIIESCRRLGEGFGQGIIRNISFNVLVQAVVAVTIIVKFFLSIYCYRVAARTGSNSVEAYAQDHRNDVFTNSLGVLGLYLAVAYNQLWMLDPIAAIGIACWIVYSWAMTAHENMDLIVGKTAEPDFLKKLTFLAFTHDAEITKVDTIRAYHFGEGFLVETDVVLPPGMPLQQAHDIGESLQIKLEKLENVERAFVHLDYEWTHKPEHNMV